MGTRQIHQSQIHSLNVFCYKEFKKFARCKSFSQIEATFIVYSEPIETGYVNIKFP